MLGRPVSIEYYTQRSYATRVYKEVREWTLDHLHPVATELYVLVLFAMEAAEAAVDEAIAEP